MRRDGSGSDGEKKGGRLINVFKREKLIEEVLMHFKSK